MEQPLHYLLFIIASASNMPTPDPRNNEAVTSPASPVHKDYHEAIDPQTHASNTDDHVTTQTFCHMGLICKYF